MPTRSFGDYYLKHQDFNDPKNAPRNLGFRTIKNFKGPYITHRPQIKIIELTGEEKGFLLSSDGLYDEFKTGEVAAFYEKMKDDHPAKIISVLSQNALKKAAGNAEILLDDLISMPQGSRKRNIHDDITLLYVNLANQTS